MKIAVSACLLGNPCRYDGKSKPCEAVIALSKHHVLVPVCPEVLGSLPTPRSPSEIVSLGPLHVASQEGNDRTPALVAGAQEALDVAKRSGCEIAVLKSKSPSCGSGLIYDGTFSGTLVEGWGVAAALFRDEGMTVVDEHDLSLLR